MVREEWYFANQTWNYKDLLCALFFFFLLLLKPVFIAVASQ